ncbi:hypothetical protein METBIDRAFT_190388 [Metschnikowia bicuspidata var. bicuspidata NRRL YB-4993]|uniref:Uncharacterized protein n=1 Tax=Metschnikowia bicuspidata var. bicuspidata NRRL YB-4993 TaxID=869754 RepID=A0A1A0HCD8_9ASCO|nr:hypothetical protein METBIDRAFT_190388 [Metschnikowia bicuspidata var. bicuspidata NRRL YB-4993]OBA21661.1 hypothetical protein METBIDRAFT_190388 [Metschnikowia bicuspidata var. bicuspidata NRRL YB-4993]
MDCPEVMSSSLLAPWYPGYFGAGWGDLLKSERASQAKSKPNRAYQQNGKKCPSHYSSMRRAKLAHGPRASYTHTSGREKTSLRAGLAGLASRGGSEQAREEAEIKHRSRPATWLERKQRDPGAGVALTGHKHQKKGNIEKSLRPAKRRAKGSPGQFQREAPSSLPSPNEPALTKQQSPPQVARTHQIRQNSKPDLSNRPRKRATQTE